MSSLGHGRLSFVSLCVVFSCVDRETFRWSLLQGFLPDVVKADEETRKADENYAQKIPERKIFLKDIYQNVCIFLIFRLAENVVETSDSPLNV
jgi:hypothetical protein